MAEAMLTQSWNVQELFLICCVPTLDEIIWKLYPKSCEQCRASKLSQNGHQCLYQSDYLLQCVLEKSCAILKQKRHQIIQHINTLLETKKVQFVNGDTVLSYLGQEVDPFNQLLFDSELQERLREKMTEFASKKDWTALTIQKQPDITDSLVKLGKSLQSFIHADKLGF